MLSRLWNAPQWKLISQPSCVSSKTYISLQSFQCADNWATMCTCIILIQPMHLLRRVYWAWNMYHSVYFVFLIITFSRFIFIDSSILYSVFFKNCIVLHCIDTICICRGILGVKYVLHSLYYNLYSPICNCSKGRLSAMQGILANLRLKNLVIGLINIIILFHSSASPSSMPSQYKRACCPNLCTRSPYPAMTTERKICLT